MMMYLPLNEAPMTQSLTIHSIDGEPDFVCRMYELGIFPGTRLRVAHRAPFSGPVHLKCARFSFFIRRAEAAHIVCGLE